MKAFRTGGLILVWGIAFQVVWGMCLGGFLLTGMVFGYESDSLWSSLICAVVIFTLLIGWNIRAKRRKETQDCS